MSPFWPIDHTADLGLLIRARDLGELITEAAKGLSLLLANEFVVQPRLWREVTVEAPDREVLLVDFLSEILALTTEERLVAVKVEPVEVSDSAITARVGLVTMDKKAVPAQEIKAVTYHDLKITDTPDGLEATVIFDV